MVSDPNVEQNNSHDGNNTLILVPPPVNSTTPASKTPASKTKHDENSRIDDSNSSNESGDDTSTTAYSGSRCTTSRRTTPVNEDMVSQGGEEGVQSARMHCSHLTRRTRQDQRRHVNHALSEIRSSLDAALSIPLRPQFVINVRNDTFRIEGGETMPDDRFNRAEDENNCKANPVMDANRVELVNQASSIIREISRDNMRLRQEIGEMIAGRQTSVLTSEQQSGSDNVP